MPAPIPYSDALEQPRPDEAETHAAIIRTMTAECEAVEAREGHAVRPSHAKATGCLKAELEVLGDLPPELAQGLFARPARYPALLRFAQGPGETLSDTVSTHRGLAIKVLGVEGERLPGHRAATQDFLLSTGRAFPQPDAEAFLRDLRPVAASALLPEAAKAVVSAASRAAAAAVEAVAGHESPVLRFFGHTPRHPLSDSYFSQAPLRWGQHVAKIGVFPASPDLLDLGDDPLELHGNPNAFRAAVVGFFRRHQAVFELRAQLCTDAEAMPVEDASVEWDEAASPYRTVARIFVPMQEAHSDARAAFFQDRLAFNPAHSLAAHRPLGSVMRARLAAYGALQDHRARRNGVAPAEPAALAEVPD